MLTDRAKGHHNSWKNVCSRQQRLTTARSCGQMGMPYTAEDLHTEASAICGKEVGKKWHKEFELCHPGLRAAKPAKLDPIRREDLQWMVINYRQMLNSLVYPRKVVIAVLLRLQLLPGLWILMTSDMHLILYILTYSFCRLVSVSII